MSRSNSQQMTDCIMAMVKSQPMRGFRRAEIRRYLGHVDEFFFRESFKALVAGGKLVRVRGGRYVCAEATTLRKGVIRVLAKGFGFVHFGDGTKDAYIPAEETLGALSGDTVLVELDADDDERGPSGSVKKIVSRGHERFVGYLAFTADGYVVRPLRHELPASLPVVADYGEDVTGGCQEGDWVQAQLVPGNRPRSPMSAKIVGRLSEGGSLTRILNAVVKEYGLPRKYGCADDRRLSGIQPVCVTREDLTALDAVTIDPVDAKDFDDAVSYAPGPRPGTACIGVHIADVACFVRPDSLLDRQARERGFTSYLPGRTIAMLPGLLSECLCSLRAGEEHPAHSVLMTVSLETGEVLESRRVHSVIRVRRRLTFDEAARVIAGDVAGAGVSDDIAELLQKLYKASVALRSWRRGKESFLPLGIAEYHVLTGGRPLRVQGVVRRESSPSSEMVEEFMLAANVRVALELQAKGIPALYRNHGEPDAQAVEDFRNLAIGVLGRKQVPSFGKRKDMARFFGKLGDSTGGELLCMSFLRCMPRAEYGAECAGHYGLGKSVYCHFTSPIRRYPDLQLHQQLLAYDLGEPLRDGAFESELAQEVNGLENTIDQACFAALDRMKMTYLEAQQECDAGRCHEAYVLRAAVDHLNLYLPEFGLMGIMENARFGDDRWHYDARTKAVISHSGQAFRCGNTIYVQIKRIDTVHGDVLLKPVQ